jgi:orotate phosphoribosyltransferase
MSISEQTIHAEVAKALLAINAVVFSPQEPITFKSGIVSPVYVDNRRLPFWPVQWHTVIDALQQIIALQNIPFHVIAGIEAAGIPHSSALGYAMHLPSVFVRKETKEHGTRRRIEGGDVKGRRVLLVEDMVTTGGSSLSGVKALREAGAIVERCMSITSYGFPEAQHGFDEAGVRLTPLTTFSTLVVEASKMGMFGADELGVLEAWMRDPHGWAADQNGGESE